MAEVANHKVSIITATFNSEKYLEKTIQSVMAQKYSNIEYIIVDGGSTDNTLKIVEKYNDKIDQVISEADNGIYDAFNKGVALATGDIIYFLNSDDYLINETIIANVVDVFQNNIKLDIVYGNIVIFDEKTGNERIDGHKVNLQELPRVLLPPQQAFFVKTALFEKIGLFDLSYKICSDLDFLVKCFIDKNIATHYINEKIAVFRIGGLSSNPVNRKLRIDEQNRVRNKYFNMPFSIDNERGNIDNLYRSWLEVLLLQRRGISNCLKKNKIEKVAIFGTKITGQYLLEDLLRENFKVKCFLDNDKSMHNQLVSGVPVYGPDYLLKSKAVVDAVVISIESSSDLEVKKNLQALLKEQNIHVITWKQLVEQSWDA